jgi:UDP-N-acetylmuramate-alanine ligase
MTDYQMRLGVSGSHGKSTVTAMTDGILKASGREPTTLVGAALYDTGLPIRIGSGSLLIYEACAYKDSFLRFSPTAAVYTSLELDHTDYFRDIDAIKASFRQSVSACPMPVLSLDSEPLSEIASAVKHSITYGEEKGDITAVITALTASEYPTDARTASRSLYQQPTSLRRILPNAKHSAESENLQSCSRHRCITGYTFTASAVKIPSIPLE